MFPRQCRSMGSYHCDRPAPAVWSQRAPQPHTERSLVTSCRYVNLRGTVRWMMLVGCLSRMAALMLAVNVHLNIKHEFISSFLRFFAAIFCPVRKLYQRGRNLLIPGYIFLKSSPCLRSSHMVMTICDRGTLRQRSVCLNLPCSIMLGRRNRYAISVTDAAHVKRLPS